MYCTRKVTDDLIWVGADDRRLPFFEGVYGVPDGVSYNSYLLLDEKTVLFDTVDKAVYGVFLENVAHALGGRGLDYLIIHHMEPDHAATLELLLQRYPEVTVICNAKIKGMIAQFFPAPLTERFQIVKEGDTFSAGKHSFTFVMAPMVHWPEVMMTYDETAKTLFTADAFGTFGALNGHLFADEVDFFSEHLDEARRYYTNIVGKYGTQVQAVLKKAAKLDIALVCPLHGFVWREGFDKYVVLVFVVMAVQFESIKFSFMVMFTIPFSLIGSFGLLFLADCKISMISMIGFLMLVGTVVNNGILYVDTATHLRSESGDLDNSLVEAGAIRLRPIFMTTLTTIIAMVPMGLKIGKAGQYMQGLALVNIGGLIASTMLSLLLLPVLYRMMSQYRKKPDEITDVD